MKIVHINTTDNRGGAAQIAYLLHKELGNFGIESRMLVREKNTNDPTVATFGIRGWRRWLSILTGRNHTFAGGEGLLSHPWLQEADIIHLHNLHGYYFHLPVLKDLVKNKKVIWTLHDMWTMTGHSGTSLADTPNAEGIFADQRQFDYEPILWPRGKALGRSKKKILEGLPITYVTPSEWLMNRLKKSYLKNQKCIHIPNGLDTKIFYNQKKEQGTNIALFIANTFNDPVKGSETLEKLLRDKRLTNVQFIAIGKGTLPVRPNLTSIPYIKDKEEIAKYYTAADIFLHPALMDNFPSVVLESLLSGTPVVAYNVGGLPEQVRNGSDGRIVPAHNYEKFISAALEILQKGVNSQEISHRAKQEFSSEHMTERYLNLYTRSDTI